jgi:uncharacterized protein YjbI with pentapeptide repeats
VDLKDAHEILALEQAPQPREPHVRRRPDLLHRLSRLSVWIFGAGYFIGPGANLIGANLTGLNLSGANATNANLTNANLTNANVTGTNFSGANMTGTNTTGAIWDGTTIWPYMG